MVNEDEMILLEVCKKYGLDIQYLKTLMEIEKDYANKNMMRRTGIFNEIKSFLDKWANDE